MMISITTTFRLEPPFRRARVMSISINRPSFDENRMSLGKQGVNAVKWSSISTAARFILQFAGQVILARMLGPRSYGIFAMGVVVLTMTNVFSNFGFGWSLLHKKDVTEEDIRFAFTWQTLVGAMATLVLFLLAPTLAGFFHEPGVEWVIRWLAFACVINASSSTATHMTYRNLKFKAAGLIQIGGYIAGYLLVGIPMAYLGFGVQALVLALLVQSSFGAIGGFVNHPHSVKPLFRFPGAGAALRTGVTVFFTNIINWCLSSMDRFLLSRFSDAHTVGVYSMGINLATTPSSLLMGLLQPAFAVAGSKMHEDIGRMRNVYLQVLATLVVLLMPVFVFLSVSSFDLVALLYGKAWAETAQVLMLMFISVPAILCLGLSTPVLWNFGRKRHESILQLPLLLLALPCFCYSIKFGIHAFALVALMLAYIRAIVVCASVFNVLRIRLAEVIPYLLRGIVLSLLTAVIAHAGAASVDSFGHPALKLLVSGILTAAVIGSLALAKPAVLGAHAIVMISRFSGKLGAVLNKRLA
jgi:lipopolysaccharide exporter